jgi:hypothetical protein
MAALRPWPSPFQGHIETLTSPVASEKKALLVSSKAALRPLETLIPVQIDNETLHL